MPPTLIPTLTWWSQRSGQPAIEGMLEDRKEVRA